MVLPAQIDITETVDGQIYLQVRPFDEEQKPIDVPMTKAQAHGVIQKTRTALSRFRPEHEHVYIKEAKRYAKEGFLEIDYDAIVLCADKDEGAFVETWHWIDAEEAFEQDDNQKPAVEV